MKVVILAGGFGTRLAEYTDLIPKPMVTIGGQPIIWHIMKRYAEYGFNDFHLALGYKADVVKKYFLDLNEVNSDFTLDLKTGKRTHLNRDYVDWKVTLIDTGLETLTGGRVKRLKSYIGKEPFMLTYGDGLSNVDIPKLLSFHKKNKKMVTVTAVRPVARFGELQIEQDIVSHFRKNPKLHLGGLMVGTSLQSQNF
jgi:glucose-1-phosphate cytidylyltransferase